MENKQTAVDTLFEVFKVMSNSMREAGDEQYANILDYLCNEFLNKAKQMEKEQIKQAFKDCHDLGHIYGLDTEQYYNETYGK
jgi:hypothetical protein